MFTVRAEDLQGTRPDPMAIWREEHLRAIRREEARIEKAWLWWWRRNLALAYLAGYIPPTAAERWWERHEDDALAYAEVYT